MKPSHIAIYMVYTKELKKMIDEKDIIKNINKEFFESYQYLLTHNKKLAKEKIEKGMEFFEFLNPSTK